MALKIDEILELSLDEYIAMSKKPTFNSIAKTNHERIPNDGSKDVKFGRRKDNIDNEDEDGDILMKPPKDGCSPLEPKEEPVRIHHEQIKNDIWKGPDSSICYIDCNDQQNDLREKLNKCNKKVIAPKFSAVQYRIMAPNNAADRPHGLPTLLPIDVSVNNGNFNQNRGMKKHSGNRWCNNFQRGFFNSKNNSTNTSNIHGCGIGNGRIQKSRKQEAQSKNLRFSVARNSGKNNLFDLTDIPAEAQNMIIKTPSNCVNLAQSPPLSGSYQFSQHSTFERLNNNVTHNHPIGNLTSQAQAVLNSIGTSSTSLTGGCSNESLKSLLGFQGNVSSEMMPIFASRLMDYIQNGFQNLVVHKPVYDMKIQKEIHEIQRKRLLYKCPGGDIISSDGAGVNCKIIPRTSGVSLNCRFA